MVSITTLLLLVTASNARRMNEDDVQAMEVDGLEAQMGHKTCEDLNKWGEGCDLDCPSDCPLKNGCDFLGNCLPPQNCKHQEGVAFEQETRVREVVNARGECQACNNGFFGLYCENECPANCKKKSCTRGGRCYACEKGYFGEQCNNECPAACPKCVFTDNLVLDPHSGQFLPAGTCPEQCKSDTFGPKCDQKCPATCKKDRKGASCAKESGTCFGCQEGFFGAKCEQTCSANCDSGGCDKNTGKCHGGCKPGFRGDRCEIPCGAGCLGACDRKDGSCPTCKSGFWGEYCELAAPEGSTGDVDKSTGKPSDCKETTFPFLDGTTWSCKSCPGNCIDSMCNHRGHCTRGCATGFFGKDCDKSCPGNCVGACDTTATSLADGYCTECRSGFAGKHCTTKCHANCVSCEQHNAGACLSCRDDEPAQLEAHILQGKKCSCIAGASRDSDGRCKCDEPKKDKDIMMARFENRDGVKSCRTVCKLGYHEILGKQDFTCMSAQEHTAVVRAVPEGGSPADLPQGDCNSGERKVGSKCVREDFINYIIFGTV